jgi:transcriptional regulator
MYIPAAFRETRPDVLHAIIRDQSFGTLVSVVEGQLFATHVPILLFEEVGEQGTLRAHMARANPHWHAFEQPQAVESLVIFQGPHAYISPSWYVSELAVPTWNYVAVHAYGTPSIINDREQVRELLEATVGNFEAGRPDPWSTSMVPEDYVENMARSIVAFEIPISRIEGKRKLGQNRPVEDMRSAAAALRSRGDALSVEVSVLMLEAAATRASR